MIEEIINSYISCRINVYTADVSQWNVSVVRRGYTLTCDMTGLSGVPGRVVWKKDHQYFSNQSHSVTFSLTSDEYKNMIDDNTNRYIANKS